MHLSFFLYIYSSDYELIHFRVAIQKTKQNKKQKKQNHLEIVVKAITLHDTHLERCTSFIAVMSNREPRNHKLLLTHSRRTFLFIPIEECNSFLLSLRVFIKQVYNCLTAAIYRSAVGLWECYVTRIITAMNKRRLVPSFFKTKFNNLYSRFDAGCLSSGGGVSGNKKPPTCR